jgi:hypothetical protein|tara:strand:+ start:1006 stop:1692 length:687 start_codon:yes stop_codon:yes gene_type:complete
MKKLQRLQTTNLFYNRYVYRLRIKNDVGAIFRGMNLGNAKAKIDEMQSFAEAGQRIPFPFRYFRDKDKFLSLETFMDAYTIYSALEKNVDKCMVRVENFTLDLYSNDNEWLEDLGQKIDAVSITEPADDESLNFLLENKNTVIQNTEVIWPYKAILGKTVDPNFATYCKNNANIKIGKRALECIQKRHNTEGYYFFTKNEKHLMLAKIALGGSISKIIKYVSDKELHK